MDLSRQEYPALLASLQPSQATSVLNDRVRSINKVNTDIADWLQERRRVEEAYAQGLRKLTHRPQLDNASALGIFQIPWKRIMTATESIAESHEGLAQKIEADVERPLREYSSKSRDLSSMPGVQSDMAGLAKSLEAAQKKVDKTKEKGPKAADKLASAIAAAEEVHQQWNSRAPFVFEQLQAADEGRLNHLRDVLTQLETHEVDQVERCREAAESCLNVLLNVETGDEITTFAAKINGGRPVTRRQEQSAPGPATASTMPLPPPPRIHDDAASERSGRSAPSKAPPAPEPRSTPLGGLRRLGTVMNRRKSVVQSSEKKHRSPFAPFKRVDSSRETQIPEDPPGADRPDTGVTTQDNVSDFVRGTGESLDRGGLAAISSSPEPQPAPTTTNGTAPPEIHGEPGLLNPIANQPRVDSEGYSEKPETIDEITRIQREASGLDESALNLTIRDQPIFEDESQAKRAMDDMANTLRLRAQQTGIRRNTGTLRGRRDVRNTVFIPNPSSPGQEGLSPQVQPGTDIPMPASPVAPAKHVTSPSTATDEHTISDNTSIRSGHTLNNAPGALVHPELHEPGLNASIIETVNAWFSEGAVTKSFVVGELALAHSPVPDSPSGSARVRLDNFQVLEKVAANPNFVSETPTEKGKEHADEKRGEYTILLSSISRPAPTVAFKYQVHIDQSNTSAYCPVIFKPAWNLEESQASAIIFYSLNPEFTSTTPVESVILKNLILTVNLDTSPGDETTESREVAHATSAVMYPNSGATFRRKHSAVIWKLPELEVKAGEDGKFLVRFSASSSWPKKGKVEAKFDLQMAQAGIRLGISTASMESQKGTDPFADEDSRAETPETQTTWKGVPTARKLVAAKYLSS